MMCASPRRHFFCIQNPKPTLAQQQGITFKFPSEPYIFYLYYVKLLYSVDFIFFYNILPTCSLMYHH